MPRRHPRLAITTSLTEPGALPATTRERTLPRPPDPRRPWFWLAAILLHAAIISLFLITFRRHPPLEAQSPPGVSIVFDNGGQQQAMQPKAQIKAPPSVAQAPAPAAPPPPAETQPEVNLGIPEFSAPLPAPTPLPSPAPRAAQASKRQPMLHEHPAQRYTVMNNLSFGHPAPPVPFQKRALNLDLSAADQDVMNGPEVSVKGDAGPDWNAELDQWVEDHKYYPDSAIEQGQQGNVRIHFTVDRAGRVSGLRMEDSSGSPFLDQAWLGLFEGAQLPPFPTTAKDNTVTVDATMHFILLH